MGKLNWPAVGLIAVLAGVVVALAAFTGWGSGEILAVVGILAGIGGGAAVGSAVGGRVDEVHKETQAQTSTLDSQTETLGTIARRVNGELDGRIQAGMEEAAEMGAARALAVLRDQGVIR